MAVGVYSLLLLPISLPLFLSRVEGEEEGVSGEGGGRGEGKIIGV